MEKTCLIEGLRKPVIVLVGLAPLLQRDTTRKIEKIFPERVIVKGCSGNCTDTTCCAEADLLLLGGAALKKGLRPTRPFLALISETDEDLGLMAAKLGAEGYLPPRASEQRFRLTLLMVASRKGHFHLELSQVIERLDRIKENTTRRIRA